MPNEPTTENGALRDAVFERLPSLLASAGCRDAASLERAIAAFHERFGHVSGRAGNVMLDNAIMAGFFDKGAKANEQTK